MSTPTTPPLPELPAAAIRRVLGCADVDDGKRMLSDNLSIALCSYFEHHMDRPADDADTENGWGAWVESKCNDAVGCLANALAPLFRSYALQAIEADRAARVPDEYEFALLQDGLCAASGSAPALQDVVAEANHYAMMYGQDGPVELEFYAVYRCAVIAAGKE